MNQIRLSETEQVDHLNFNFLSKLGSEICSDNMDEINFSFDKEILNKFLLIKEKYKLSITPFLFGKSIYAILLNRYFGQKKFYLEEAVYDFEEPRTILDIVKQSQNFVEPLSDNYNAISFEQGVRDDGVNYKILYNANKIDFYLLNKFINCYKRIFIEVLEELVTVNYIEKLRKTKDYQLLSSEEYNKVINLWNKTEAEYPTDKTIHQLFEEQVEKNPDNVALVVDERKLSYRELNSRANQLASYLRENYQIKPDTLVVLCLERNEHMLIAILAVLKAGGAYVPIDPSYPDERITYILEDTGSKVILANELHEERLQGLKVNANIITIDNNLLQGKLQDEPFINLPSITAATNLAYVIYTSGTTGKPKGVVVGHRELVSFCYQNNYCPINSSTVTLGYSNYAFDGSVMDIFATLTNSGKLVLINKDLIVNETILQEVIEKHEVNTIFITTALFSLYSHLRHKNPLNTIDNILFGGEKVNVNDVARFFKFNNNASRLIHVYGPTENITFSTYCIINNNNMSIAPIGKNLADKALYVLDSNLNPLPIGAVGELYIGGDGVARGYLNRPELTAERFLKNPFQTEVEKQNKKYGENGRNARIYKTGDLVRWLPDGNLEYIGRNDFQVKIRGHRIELGEIENLLSSYQDIKQSVVLAKEYTSNNSNHTVGSKYLVGYYVADKKLKEDEIFYYLREKLPDYMIPSALVYLEKLPMTINGKLDSKALPNPEFTKSEDYVAPKNDTQLEICSIFAETLIIPQDIMGIKDSFLRLGGNSLLAIHVINEISKRLNVKLKVGDIFHHSIIEDLAVYIDTLPKMEYKVEAAPSASDNKLNIPLTFSQEQIWLHEQESNGAIIYNEPFSITMPMEICTIALEKSINELVKRYDILRARIKVIDGVPLQSIVPYSFFQINFIDLSHIKDNECCEIEAHKLATEQAKKPFDLENEQLIRFMAVKIRTNLYKLFIVAHHIIIDGVSLYQVMLPDLVALYKSFVNNTVVNLPKLDFQYTDFALWQKSKQNDYSKEITYWKEQLQGVEPVAICKDTKIIRNHGTRNILNFPPDLASGLIELGYKHEASQFVILLTALNVLLYKYTGQTDLAICSPTSGRKYKFMETMLGHCVNTVIFRNNLSGNPTYAKLLDLVKENAFNIYENDSLPLQEVMKLIDFDKTKTFPFQVALVLEPDLPSNDLDWELSQLDIHTDTAKFHLTIALDQKKEGLIGKIEYNTDVFTHEFIQTFIEHFKTVIKRFIEAPQGKIGDFCLLSNDEYQKIVYDWNGTEIEYPTNKTIHQLFEEQASKTPDNIALVVDETKLSYRELNGRANQLANYLREYYKIKPDTLVVLCLERNEHMLISILAVLKAGGAYVPVSPSYPDDRITYILNDTGSKVILTNEVHEKRLEGLKVSANILAIDNNLLQKELQDNPVANLPSIAASTHLVYVIYTSGTTGKPKGVMIEHRGVVNLALMQSKEFGLTNQKVKSCLWYSNYVFDAHVWEVYSTILTGNAIHLINDNIRQDISMLAQYIQHNNVTVATVPPALLNDKNLLLLNTLVVAGEKTSKEILDFYYHNNVRVINAYGPSETTVCATLNHYNNNGITNIGSPISNHKCYVLDSNLNPLPIGAVGELCIGGDGVARGYLNRPELTAERFLKNPFQTEVEKQNKKYGENGRNARIYKTGDLVRWLPDGNLEYIGRNDFQVKIRGHRIELGEIEACIQQHPGITKAIVTCHTDNQGTKYIAAYYTCDNNVSNQQLSNYLNQSLPSYMVPQALTMLENLPMTINGKIDLKALEKLKDEAVINAPVLLATTFTEVKLVEVLSEVLGHQVLDINTSFFALGLDSLKNFRFVSLLARNGINITIQQLHSYNTIRLLARSIDFNLKEQGIISIKNTTDNSIKNSKHLILIPPAGGSIEIFRDLVKELHGVNSIYAIQLTNEDLNESELISLSRKIAINLEKTLPNSQYTLVGHSLGAIIAYELAQILGNKVTKVFMLDSTPLVAMYYLITGNLWLHGIAQFARIKGYDTYIIKEWISQLNGLSPEQQLLNAQDLMQNRFTYEELKYFVTMYAHNMQLIKIYEPSKNCSNGKFILCGAEDQTMFEQSDGLFSRNADIMIPEDLGLSKLVPNRQLYKIPGNHISMLLNPNSIFLSQLLLNCRIFENY